MPGGVQRLLDAVVPGHDLQRAFEIAVRLFQIGQGAGPEGAFLRVAARLGDGDGHGDLALPDIITH